MKILIVTTAVAPAGGGIAGGVDVTLASIILALSQKHYDIHIIAPEGSKLPHAQYAKKLFHVSGELQPSIQHVEQNARQITKAHSLLQNMWTTANGVQAEYDFILNLGYDYLPLKLTYSFKTPIYHLISMSSLHHSIDKIITDIAHTHPRQLAFHTETQKRSFNLKTKHSILYNGFHLSRSKIPPTPKHSLAWVGRISPEKGLEDAVGCAQRMNIPIKIWGFKENKDYFNKIITHNRDAKILYQGFHPREEMLQQLKYCSVLLMTHKWLEAFGICVVDAISSGVPVISYDRGGPSEIISHGITGMLVQADNLDAMVKIIPLAMKLDRYRCQREAHKRFSINAFGNRLAEWLPRYS